MKLKEAKILATEIMDLYPDYNLKIVGSIARKSAIVNDIDFVTNVPLPQDSKYISGVYKGVQYDIWYFENLNIGKFLRTTSKGHLIAIYIGLKKNGYQLTTNGILNLKTEKIIPFTEKKILKLSGVDI